MEIMYATREQVSRSFEALHSAYAGARIDEAVKAASRSAEGLLHRRFYPERRTIALDWPSPNNSLTWEIHLGDQELISLESATAGGNTITSGVLLKRGDDLAEPPYSSIETDLSTNFTFSAGVTFQGAVSLTGVFGYNETATTTPGGALDAGINSSVAAVVINPSNGLLSVGTGSLLLVGTERMVVLSRSMGLSGATLSTSLLDINSGTLVATSDGTLFAAGETILIDSERMYVNEVVGNNLIVTRAYDGTVLAEHSSTTAIYALRNAIVQRGALGSTAASHDADDPVYVHEYPSLLNQLVTLDAGIQLTTGNAADKLEWVERVNDVRARAYQALGRMQRSMAV